VRAAPRVFGEAHYDPTRPKTQARLSASHATLDPDPACSAAQDGMLSLSKAATRLTQMMKAGDTFLFFTSGASCSVQVCQGTITTA
jgi:hypothetical protein